MFLLSFQTYSQKRIDLIITIDSSIEKKNIEMSFFNGNVDKDIIDTFHNNFLKLKIPFYTEYFPLNIYYTPKIGNSLYYTFFLNNRKATILLQKVNGSIVIASSNALLISDTVSFILNRDLMRCRLEIAKKITKLYEKHQGDVYKVDSLRRLRDLYFKDLNKESMDFFAMHSSEYFSLYYFWSQIVNVSKDFFRNDSTYLRSLVNYFKNTFPKKYQESYEGQNILLSLETAIKPPSINSLSPNFLKLDVNGKKVSSESLKGKYVLFDFWASWCPPCLASIPFLKELKAKFPAESFAIIGINTDSQIEEMRKTIVNKKINWTQIFDINGEMFNKFAVGPIPTFILVDKEGKIIFRGVGSDDQEQLLKMLESLTL